MSNLVYDLSQCRSSLITKSTDGQIKRVEYKLPDGKSVVLTLKTDTSDWPVGAVVTVDDRIVGEADFVRRGPGEGWRLEEKQYSPAGSEQVRYRARLHFARSGQKEEEIPVEGTKLYEFFPRYPF